jgi:hypothetical protein
MRTALGVTRSAIFARSDHLREPKRGGVCQGGPGGQGGDASRRPTPTASCLRAGSARATTRPRRAGAACACPRCSRVSVEVVLEGRAMVRVRAVADDLLGATPGREAAQVGNALLGHDDMHVVLCVVSRPDRAAPAGNQQAGVTADGELIPSSSEPDRLHRGHPGRHASSTALGHDVHGLGDRLLAEPGRRVRPPH